MNKGSHISIQGKKIHPMVFILALSALVRTLVAGWVELGNDEAYYWTYAMFPDWSHFDHPGMVGWMMQLFSLNLRFDSELFLRLSSVVFMTLNTWIVYCIGKELRDEALGVRAALLYTASVYAFVITGIFILPDTPQNLFWLLGFWGMLRYLKRRSDTALLLAGLAIGLCLLSKYTGAFLWLGFGLYVLLFDRKSLKNPVLYLSLVLTAACCFPILYWNVQNDFVSFRFHGDRVGLFGKLNLNSFATEVAGEFLYNNPVNYVLAVLAVIAAFRKKLTIEIEAQRLILFTALPMIGLFLFFSLTRSTLPHWSGPAFNLLVFLSAGWLEEKKKKNIAVTAALTVLFLILSIGIAEIKTGFLPLDRHTEARAIGKDDFSLDLYGWRQAGEKFAALRAQKIAEGEMHEDDAIIGNNWFPTASIDYYLARPLQMRVLGYGTLERMHKYLWINDQRGGFEIGSDYWYIADSHFFIDPEQVYAYTNFKHIELVGVIPIERHDKVVRNLFVYECKGLVYPPPTLSEQIEHQHRTSKRSKTNTSITDQSWKN